MRELDQQRLRELFTYEDGELIWHSRPREEFKSRYAWLYWNTRYSGTIAGSLVPNGYKRLEFKRKSYAIHRLIWRYMHDTWPETIDHIDGNRANNKIDNLRDVSMRENSRNKAIPKNNKSGVIGVYRDAWSWRAVIGTGTKQINLGAFPSKDAAIAARKAAELQYGYHPNHGRVAA